MSLWFTVLVQFAMFLAGTAFMAYVLREDRRVQAWWVGILCAGFTVLQVWGWFFHGYARLNGVWS